MGHGVCEGLMTSAKTGGTKVTSNMAGQAIRVVYVTFSFLRIYAG